jgi:hypothetical protein
MKDDARALISDMKKTFSFFNLTPGTEFDRPRANRLAHLAMVWG